MTKEVTKRGRPRGPADMTEILNMRCPPDEMAAFKARLADADDSKPKKARSAKMSEYLNMRATPPEMASFRALSEERGYRSVSAVVRQLAKEGLRTSKRCGFESISAVVRFFALEGLAAWRRK